MPTRAQKEVQHIIDYTRELEWRAPSVPERAELIAEAVLLCAGKVQDLTTPESAHYGAMRRLLGESDVGSRETLHRMRGVLRAAAQLDGLGPAPPLQLHL
jgi:hypothetical protein